MTSSMVDERCRQAPAVPSPAERNRLLPELPSRDRLWTSGYRAPSLAARGER